VIDEGKDRAKTSVGSVSNKAEDFGSTDMHLDPTLEFWSQSKSITIDHQTQYKTARPRRDNPGLLEVRAKAFGPDGVISGSD